MPSQSVPKVRANLTLDSDLLSEARTLDINLSQAAEAGVRQAVKKAKEGVWREENATALQASNRWVEEHGLPLGDYRPF